MLHIEISSYNSTLFGPSGNITVNGSLTCLPETPEVADLKISARGLGAGQQQGIDLNAPPYAIHNGESDASCDMDLHGRWLTHG